MKKILRHFWYKWPDSTYRKPYIIYYAEYIYWNILAFLRYITPIYISSLNFSKLWKEWRHTHGIFKKPHVKYQKFKIKHSWREYPWNRAKWWRIFELVILPLQWKPKMDDLDWEHNPQVYIRLFGYWGWHWMLEAPQVEDADDTVYWEAIIYYLYDTDYCKGNLYNTYLNNIHTIHSSNPERDGKVLTILPYLNEDYYNYLKKYIERKENVQ